MDFQVKGNRLFGDERFGNGKAFRTKAAAFTRWIVTCFIFPRTGFVLKIKLERNKKPAAKGPLKHVLIVFTGTFFCGTLISLAANATVENFKVFYLVFPILLLVIAVGVVFDAIGVAALAASFAPVNARAARKAPGAVTTLKLLKKANVVANFCCDVVGDICGILSGALGATLVVIIGDTALGTVLLSALMAGMVSSLTVGSKAAMKNVAITHADRIMEAVGVVLDYRNWNRLLSPKEKTEGD